MRNGPEIVRPELEAGERGRALDGLRILLRLKSQEDEGDYHSRALPGQLQRLVRQHALHVGGFPFTMDDPAPPYRR